jgi:hypothetical protein
MVFSLEKEEKADELFVIIFACRSTCFYTVPLATPKPVKK